MRIPGIICFAGIAFLPPAAAGDERPLQLQVLEAEFEKEFEAGATQLETKYREALTALAKKFKAEGNLDGVVAIKTELESLETHTSNEPVIITLGAKAATPSGRVSYDGKHRLLRSWRGEGGAHWNLTGLPRGTYALTIHYYAGPFAGGKLRISAGGANSELAITSDDSWKELRFAPAGDIEIGADATALRFSILEARGLGLFELLRVELEPVAE